LAIEWYESLGTQYEEFGRSYDLYPKSDTGTSQMQTTLVNDCCPFIASYVIKYIRSNIRKT